MCNYEKYDEETEISENFWMSASSTDSTNAGGGSDGGTCNIYDGGSSCGLG